MCVVYSHSSIRVSECIDYTYDGRHTQTVNCMSVSVCIALYIVFCLLVGRRAGVVDGGRAEGIRSQVVGLHRQMLQQTPHVNAAP